MTPIAQFAWGGLQLLYRSIASDRTGHIGGTSFPGTGIQLSVLAEYRGAIKYVAASVTVVMDPHGHLVSSRGDAVRSAATWDDAWTSFEEMAVPRA